MIARSKMIEQVKYKTCLLDNISAGATSAHVSAIIDRDGYNTAYFVQQQRNLTASATSEKTVFTLYEGDCLTATFTSVDTANKTMYTIPIYSASVSAAYCSADLMVNLTGCKRYIQVYVTPTGAQTCTSNVTVTCTLGDAVTEPAS